MRNFIILAALMFIVASCKEEGPSYPAPLPIDQSTLRIEALPAQVIIRWNNPENANHYYTELSYVRPDETSATGTKECIRLASLYADSIVVNNLLNRYGSITYTLTNVSRDGQRSASVSIDGTADKAVTTMVGNGKEEKVALSLDNIYANCKEKDEGSWEALFDGKTTSGSPFFHSSWTGGCVDKSGAEFEDPGEPHILVIDLGREAYGCKFKYTTRNAGDAPKELAVWGTTAFDPSRWVADGFDATYNDPSTIEGAVQLATLKDAVTTAWTGYESPGYMAEKPFRYLWFVHSGRAYFALGELEASTLGVSIFDPETGQTTDL